MSEQDQIFMKNFALLIAGLAVFTVVVILAAIQLNKLTSRPDNPDKVAALEARIAPVGDVYAGETGAAARAAAEAAAADAAPKLAFDGSTDGTLIYNNVCAACHTSGVAGSPKLESAAWEPRLAQGMDTLVQHAIEGYQGDAGLMPARGGRMDLSDEQVRVTVQWMVDQLQ
ncbi:MAG: c-type cytochrome [Pseudomonadota bacterium]